MKYINAKAVYHLFGNSYPNGTSNLVKLLENFCHHLASSEDPTASRIPNRLVQGNLGRRDFESCEMINVDADIRVELNLRSKQQEISLLNYPAEGLERPPEQKRVALHVRMIDDDGLLRAIHLPFQPLMVGWGDVDKGYQGYSHSIAFLNDNGAVDEEYYYVGVSSRNWLKRMDEHMAEVRKGSNRLFHRRWREYQGSRSVILGSELVVLNHTYEGIMGWEEEIVRQYMENGTSLNMIPGGFEGMKFLHQHRLTQSPRVSLEERDRALEVYYLTHPRTGVPNLLVARAWESDEYYEKVITGRGNTLSADQVRKIRALSADGLSMDEILVRSGARNLGQVKRILAGTAYGRIR